MKSALLGRNAVKSSETAQDADRHVCLGIWKHADTDLGKHEGPEVGATGHGGRQAMIRLLEHDLTRCIEAGLLGRSLLKLQL